ncbi:MAG: alpha-L-fucosidase [Ignavibacteriaceae bacterium]
MKKLFHLLLIITAAGYIYPQENHGKEYFPETDSLVLKKIEQWQDLKFGLLMHWQPSSQWGVIESWSICSEDEGWCKRDMENYTEYKQKYEELKNTFNPVNFDPAKWAEAAAEAGMKYVVFTTKHHDGFNMFNTAYSDYKITDPGCPFHTNPKADVTKEIFNAFREKGLWTGAYFSKADWHSDFYWWQRFATPDRNPNYDLNKYPDRWEKFVEFTHNQIDELMTNYGRIDILWLDAGWVRHRTKEDIERERLSAGFNTYRIQNQDINMPEIARKARIKQPGLIVVDREVPGQFQNYLTPENRIPDETLPYPWETCMPMSSSWSYRAGAQYKSAGMLIHLLADIAAKGGNFLLNIGPSDKGDFEPEAYERLKEIGEWMKVNSEAIYNTHPVKPYKEGKVRFTRLKDGTIYAIYMADENEKSFPAELELSNFTPGEGSRIEILGTGEILSWNKKENGCVINFPPAVRSNLPCKYAWTLKISEE